MKAELVLLLSLPCLAASQFSSRPRRQTAFGRLLFKGRPYAFGKGTAGEQSFDAERRIAKRLVMQPPFRFFGTEYDFAYVSRDAAVSFEPWPLSTSATWDPFASELPLIAPLYKTYLVGRVHFRRLRGKELGRLAHEIRYQFETEAVTEEGLSAVAITWANMKPAPEQVFNPEAETFVQLVLASQGNLSFANVIYACADALQCRRYFGAAVGLRGSGPEGRKQMLTAAGNALDTTPDLADSYRSFFELGNTGIPGEWLWRVDGSEGAAFCKAGVKGLLCDQVCSEREWGEDCSRRCDCVQGAPCDPVTGVCPGEKREPGQAQPEVLVEIVPLASRESLPQRDVEPESATLPSLKSLQATLASSGESAEDQDEGSGDYLQSGGGDEAEAVVVFVEDEDDEPLPATEAPEAERTTTSLPRDPLIPPVRSRAIPPPPTLLERLDRDFPQGSVRWVEEGHGGVVELDAELALQSSKVQGAKTFVSLREDLDEAPVEEAPVEEAGENRPSAALKLTERLFKPANRRIATAVESVVSKVRRKQANGTSSVLGLGTILAPTTQPRGSTKRLPISTIARTTAIRSTHRLTTKTTPFSEPLPPTPPPLKDSLPRWKALRRKTLRWRALRRYGYGASFGDALMPLTDVAYRVRLANPLRFYGDDFDTLYVMGNGAVGFRDSSRHYVPDIFGSPLALIAPMWKRNDLGLGGKVFFREFPADQDPRKNQTEQELLGMFGSEVELGSTVVVSWDGMVPVDERLERQGFQGNTFQLVLYVAKDITTFARFIYHQLHYTVEGQAGFNRGDGASFYSLPKSSSKSDLQYLDSNGNTPGNERGHWLFRLDTDPKGYAAYVNPSPRPPSASP